MASSMIGRGAISRSRKQAEGGFSLLEVVISMVVLTVGLVSLLGVFGLAMASTQTSQEDMIAKQLANEAYESIITARNTSQVNWDQINNVGSPYCTGTPPCGIFLTGTNPIYFSGVDGIFGTADDAAAGLEYLEEPGPNGTYGDTDDVLLYLTSYQRTILISPLYDTNGNMVTSLRSVTITVQYSAPQTKQPKAYILNSYISQYQ
jgi:type II secretory pathway pseudopilin PulG